MQDKIVQKDVLGTDIPDALSSETATNTFLDGICYYNSLMPKRIYTESGTFDIAYYSEHYLNMSHEGFWKQLCPSVIVVGYPYKRQMKAIACRHCDSIMLCAVAENQIIGCLKYQN